MGLIKEPKDIDLSTKSEPWTEQELADFRKIMQDIKAKNAKRKARTANKSIAASGAERKNNRLQKSLSAVVSADEQSQAKVLSSTLKQN